MHKTNLNRSIAPSMKRSASITIDEQRFFWYAICVLFVIGALPLSLFNKVDFFILVKQWHHPIVDYIMPYVTWLGDSRTYVCLVIIAILWHMSWRKVLIMGVSFIVKTLIVQLLKRVFFSHMVRPSLLVPMDVDLHFIPGVKLSTNFSFPSAHSANIFTFISVVYLLSRNSSKLYSCALLCLAFLVAYSRIYLCQHFYTDLYIGALIGTSVAIGSYYFLISFNGPDWLDHSAYSIYDKCRRFFRFSKE